MNNLIKFVKTLEAKCKVKKETTNKNSKIIKVAVKVCMLALVFTIFNTTSLLAENLYSKKDITQVMRKWQDYGIIKVGSEGTVSADEYITRVEAITILNRINNVSIENQKDDYKYKDVETFRWYYQEIEKAVATGLLTGTPDGDIKPKENLTRENAYVMIAKLFDIKYKGTNADKYLDSIYETNGRHMIKEFSDGTSAGIWASPYIAGLLELGYINGFEDNTLKPQELITRGEFIQILDRICDLIISEPGEYDLSTVQGNIVINVPNVVITKANENSIIYMMAGSNSEVIIDDEEIPEAVQTGRVLSNVDYSKYSATAADVKRKKLLEMNIFNKMPIATKLNNTDAAYYLNRMQGTDQWNDIIYKVSKEEEIDPVFVKCIMAMESGGKAGTKSKMNTNGTYDYGLMQVNSSWASSFDLQRMLYDNEYAVRCGIKVIKRKVEAAERSHKNATVYEVAWRYNGYSAKGRQYAERFSTIYESLSGMSRNSLVRTTTV